MAMIALTMALGASISTAMLNVMFDVGDKVNQELKSYGANLVVVPRGASILGDLYGTAEDGGAAKSDKFLAEDELPKIKSIFWAFNIVDFAPYLDTKALIEAGGASAEATVTGTWFDKRFDAPTGESVETGIVRMKSWWDVNGSWADDGSASGMIGANLASKLKVGPGDSVLVSGKSGAEVTIKGVFNSGGAEDDALFVPLGLVQNITGREGLVSRVEASALTTPENDLARRAAKDPNSLSRHEWDTWYCTAYISSIAYQIEEVISNSRAKPVLQVAESEGAILRKTQLLMLLLTALGMACASLAISNLVTASVMERSAEIGLIKAVGASSLEASCLIMTETMITALIGGVGGYFAGMGFAQLIGRTVFGSAIAARMLVIPLVAILVIAVAVAGSLPAIRLLLSLRPAEVLHGR
jgi:putative ABC transport system permease protein